MEFVTNEADAAETRRQMREVLQRRLHRIREKVQNQRAGIDAQKFLARWQSSLYSFFCV